MPLPGLAVRFDYQSIDTSHGRLYLSHMNANQLVVFDVKAQAVVANLDGCARVHGVWAVPELGKVYASVTGDHQVAAVDNWRTAGATACGLRSFYVCTGPNFQQFSLASKRIDHRD